MCKIAELRTDLEIDDTIVNDPSIIADLLGLCVRIRLYTYSEMLEMKDKNFNIFNEFQSVKVQKEQKFPIYAELNDIKKYNLELWKK